jgi:hypothetical protein
MAEKNITKEERREMAIKGGRKFNYLVCPLCMRSIIGNPKPFRIDHDPEIIQVRYVLGGRGLAGFFKNPEECIRLSSLEATNIVVFNNLKEEIGKLYRLFHKEEI